MDKSIEALLFVSGDEGMTLEQLSSLLNASSSQIKEGIDKLNKRLKQSALMVKKQNKHYVLVTRKEVDDVLSQFAKQEFNQRLTKPALEVLSIIAYKQPITRLEIDELRGVQSSAKALQKLLSHDLICEMGRKEQPGRPKLYGTTDFFLEYFHLQSLDDLPPLLDEVEQTVEEELFTQLLEFE